MKFSLVSFLPKNDKNRLVMTQQTESVNECLLVNDVSCNFHTSNTSRLVVVDSKLQHKTPNTSSFFYWRAAQQTEYAHKIKKPNKTMKQSNNSVTIEFSPTIVQQPTITTITQSTPLSQPRAMQSKTQPVSSPTPSNTNSSSSSRKSKQSTLQHYEQVLCLNEDSANKTIWINFEKPEPPKRRNKPSNRVHVKTHTPLEEISCWNDNGSSLGKQTFMASENLAVRKGRTSVSWQELFN